MGKTLKDGANFRSVAKQLGSRGGRTTLKKLGKKHFSKMANNRWDKRKAALNELDN